MAAAIRSGSVPHIKALRHVIAAKAHDASALATDVHQGKTRDGGRISERLQIRTHRRAEIAAIKIPLPRHRELIHGQDCARAERRAKSVAYDYRVNSLIGCAQ